MTTPVPQIYDEAAEQLASECRELERRSQRFVAARAVAFLGVLVLFTAALGSPDARAAGSAFGSFCLIALVVVSLRHERLQEQLNHQQRRLSLSRNAGARWRRDWKHVPVPPIAAEPGQEALATDLDLMGAGSLFHLVCRSYTQCGREQLRDLLFQPIGEPELARQRQDAVRELQGEVPWRSEFELLSLAVAYGKATPAALAEWADAPNAAPPQSYLKPLAWALPAALWASLAVAIVQRGVIGVPILISLAVVSALVALWHTGHAFAALEHVTTSRDEVVQYQAMFDHVAQLQPTATWLADLVSQLRAQDGGPAAELARLGRITRLSSQRQAGFIQATLYMISQVVFLTDLHLLAALQHWRQRNAGKVGAWFVRLGKVEAAASLAGLAFDHPNWAWPEISDNQPSLTARGIGHPLLQETQRVTNDVEVGPPGTLLLVTGSNMSGKSTLLRSIGLNALLAQAGGPVCAAELRMPPVRLGTSVRVHDSLADGVSFFMAELKRLKQIVDMAGELDAPRLLYLLDEILQGTNSAERQIAVSHVLEHLLKAGAIGAISTHDLELASLPQLAKHCHTVHFRETLDPSQSARSMTFDYQLRQGVATTTNALKLLELVGLATGKDT
ncbi:MAG: hypothetical protein KDB14_25725 [Planctomycetales bacterium]|nr:hypothetical protein [Planctomycetales bacterium]